MVDDPEVAVDEVARPFSEFRDEGLLWLVNTMVFHPRGYALAFEINDDGDAIGWSLQGDGKERWAYAATDEMNEALDALFLKVKALMP